jgi:hypothetical protein
MKGLGLLVREELGFLFFIDCEETVCSWGGACSGDCLGEVVNDFCCVFDHRYLCNAGLGEIKVHSKVVMNWSTVDDEVIAIYCGKISCKFSDLEWFDGLICDTFRSSTCQVIIFLLLTVAFVIQGLYGLITNRDE